MWINSVPGCMWILGYYTDLSRLIQETFSQWQVFFMLILLFAYMFLYFSLFLLICRFNCNWFIRFGFANPSLYFLSVVWFKLHMNTGSLDFLQYCLKHLKWENIYNTYMLQIVIIVMSSILRQKIVCSPNSLTCR
jgi:hypothetical protein